MKFLLDTNILIPAEPTSPANTEEITPLVSQLLGLIAETKSQPYFHPASSDELLRDQNSGRRALRCHLLEKYVRLEAPPPITTAITNILGAPSPGSNTETDTLLLAAVHGNAVDFLVTSDDRIHRRANRLGIGSRVLTPEDAIVTIRALLPTRPMAPPAVRSVVCHQLDVSDSIFTSLRNDYSEFNEWFVKCQREHRQAFLIESSQGYSGVAILNIEQPGEFGLRGKVLKICTFKVADNAHGYRYGELLLKSVFDYIDQNGVEKAYLTCFPHQLELIRFLENFGFFQLCATDHGELVFTKRFDPTPEERDQIAPLNFHIKFGPRHISLSNASVYVVPIKPTFHRALFPDLERQLSIWAGETSFGNAILKAYLCHSSVKDIAPGSVLLFYRSRDWCNIQSVGIADGCMRSTDESEIARFVGQRTVYTMDQIRHMCRTETLAVLFRQSRTISPITLDDLVKHEALLGAPQQITRIKPEGLTWIYQQLEA
jgi:L-amino acid N-acyltransferase YncA